MKQLCFFFLYALSTSSLLIVQLTQFLPLNLVYPAAAAFKSLLHTSSRVTWPPVFSCLRGGKKWCRKSRTFTWVHTHTYGWADMRRTKSNPIFFAKSHASMLCRFLPTKCLPPHHRLRHGECSIVTVCIGYYELAGNWRRTHVERRNLVKRKRGELQFTWQGGFWQRQYRTTWKGSLAMNSENQRQVQTANCCSSGLLALIMHIFCGFCPLPPHPRPLHMLLLVCLVWRGQLTRHANNVVVAEAKINMVVSHQISLIPNHDINVRLLEINDWPRVKLCTIAHSCRQLA